MASRWQLETGVKRGTDDFFLIFFWPFIDRTAEDVTGNRLTEKGSDIQQSLFTSRNPKRTQDFSPETLQDTLNNHYTLDPTLRTSGLWEKEHSHTGCGY